MTSVFILDSKCNLNCEFCTCENEKELCSNEIKEELDKITGTVIFTGGEPLLRPDINELCKYAKGRNLKVGIHTNCLIFNKLNLDYVDFVNIPLDGPEEIHNLLRKNSYGGIIKALDILRSKKIRTRVTTIATKINLSQIEEIPNRINQYDNIELWRVFKFKDNHKNNSNKHEISQEQFNQLKNLKAHCRTEFIDDIDDFGQWKKICKQ